MPVLFCIYDTAIAGTNLLSISTQRFIMFLSAFEIDEEWQVVTYACG